MPLQLGVSASGGARSIGHAVSAALELTCKANPDAVLAQLDVANALNTVDQAAILEAVDARAGDCAFGP